ncbi:hypothetical protein [Streptomyces sp. C]|uniref:hypothetical protein n=1 Tax=Streptomyces sp. C TaxID=253839 RepID=UPI00101B54D0|nr:hypothetical protein [Streptomyces sp. C]
MKRITRASAALLLAAAAATAALTASTGTASAAANVSYANDLVRTYDTGDSADNWNECNKAKYVENARLDRVHPRDSQEYYYCAPGYFGNGVQRVNLWFRHRA